ncbi:MAG: L-threonylcarbamoyladenylate synthase [Rhodoferax sp.]|uniref:L-threonylcarbamoyladenylate synthase n=1 Tax=Rhodoferax sp. TaxID=50421 RepID=UPI002628E661|nr:L-threonylcarbamoyladenylate synthase [Rhodoferax sp.]MDD2879950.1 L-threonylcarbamoyladenylate synthase [Rhodoferax sp.]
MILPGNKPESIAVAADCIRAGGLLGLPTETVYGLAADADNDAAVAQIFKAKGRPADHPLIVHVADASAVAHYASEVPNFAQQLMQAFWPGPLTLILPRRLGVANAAAGGNPTIGLRCPSHPVAQALLKAINGGLAAPSANQFGRVSPTTAAHVQGEFGPDLLILDGGACGVGIESTIIDCTRGAPVLLRPGAITPAQVQAVCGLKVLLKEELSTTAEPSPKASGTLESHYAPRARVRLMSVPEIQLGLRTEAVAAGVAVWHRSPLEGYAGGAVLQAMPADPALAARQLFAVLRTFDLQGVTQIWVESPPDAPDWDGVRDRLQRAAH